MRAITAIAAALALAGVLSATGQEQVQVSVKVIEFQTGKSTETGLSAYFQQRMEPRPYGRVSSGNGTISASDLTFPASSTSGITVFLDRLVTKYGDIEIVLQALVDEGRAFILSEPTALVPVGAEASGGTPTVIQTTQKIPYEDTVVVGTVAIQTTNFYDTGVTLSVLAERIADDDGDPMTRDDTYIKLHLEASVAEEGQRITVALDDSLSAGGGIFDSPNNRIQVPEFVKREIVTDVWVRHGQVLMLGGLYRNTEDKDLATLPWLTQSDRFLNGLVQRIVPFAVEPVPISSSIGNNQFSNLRRELAFLIKADVPPAVFDVGVEEQLKRSILLRPTELVSGMLEGIAEIPQGLAEGVTGQSLGDGITSGIPTEEKHLKDAPEVDGEELEDSPPAVDDPAATAGEGGEKTEGVNPPPAAENAAPVEERVPSGVEILPPVEAEIVPPATEATP